MRYHRVPASFIGASGILPSVNNALISIALAFTAELLCSAIMVLSCSWIAARCSDGNNWPPLVAFNNAANVSSAVVCNCAIFTSCAALKTPERHQALSQSAVCCYILLWECDLMRTLTASSSLTFSTLTDVHVMRCQAPYRERK